MIVAAFLSARAWLSALPSSLRWALGGIVVALLLGLAWVIWLSNHDSEVIERHEDAIAQKAAPASEKAAEERVADAFENQRLRDQRDAAIAKAEAVEAAKAPAARATLAPTTVALNCARLRQAYSAAQLAKIPAYKDRCKA